MATKSRSLAIPGAVRRSLEVGLLFAKTLALASNLAKGGRVLAIKRASKGPSSGLCVGCLPFSFSWRSRRPPSFEVEDDDDDEVVALATLVKGHEVGAPIAAICGHMANDLNETASLELADTPFVFSSPAPEKSTTPAAANVEAAGDVTEHVEDSSVSPSGVDSRKEEAVSEVEETTPTTTTTPIPTASPKATKFYSAAPPRALLVLPSPIGLSVFFAGASHRPPTFLLEPEDCSGAAVKEEGEETVAVSPPPVVSPAISPSVVVSQAAASSPMVISSPVVSSPAFVEVAGIVDAAMGKTLGRNLLNLLLSGTGPSPYPAPSAPLTGASKEAKVCSSLRVEANEFKIAAVYSAGTDAGVKSPASKSSLRADAPAFVPKGTVTAAAAPPPPLPPPSFDAEVGAAMGRNLLNHLMNGAGGAAASTNA